MLSLILVLALILCGSVSENRYTVKAEENPEVADAGDDWEEEEENDEEDEENDEDEYIDLSEDESIEITYNITGQWDRHYNVDVTLLNITGDRIDDWELCFEFGDKIENIWNAKITDQEEGEWVVIRNADWNQDIDADQTVTFGMTVCYEEEIELPQEFFLTRTKTEVDKNDYSVQYTQYSKWDNHVNGKITITNLGSERIEDWKFTYDVKNKIGSFENIWNAELINLLNENKMVQVDNATYNQNIEPGQSVEFGFIVTCDGDPEIEDFTLYKMCELEYEEGDYPYETNSPGSEHWEPDYGPDDFETDEEYEQYLKEIGYIPRTYARSKARSKAELYKPLTAVSKELSVSYPEEKTSAKAIQSFFWTENYLFTLFNKGGASKNDACLCRTKLPSEVATIDQSKPVTLINFSHGQTLERFKANGKYRYMMCAGAGLKDNSAKGDNTKTGWGKNVIFLDEHKILKLKKKFSYTNNLKTLKRIVGIEKYIAQKTGNHYELLRIDAALSSDKSQLIIWCKMRSDDRKHVLLLNMKEIKNKLYGKKGKTYIDISSDKGKELVIAFASDPKNLLYPNGSFQSIEVSNAIGSKKNNWYGYITSGNTGRKNMELLIERFTITKDSNAISNIRRVGVRIPFNQEGKPILSDAYPHEIEGCHLKGSLIQFILTETQHSQDEKHKKKEKNKYKKTAKVEQFIVEMKREEFKKEEAEYNGA